jgi:intergrase/recombinase
MQRVVLNTVQTIALARVGSLNDVRIRKVKSFLRNIDNVNLQMSISAVQCIDHQVAWHRTKEATYGSYLHEWSLTKGKEKREAGSWGVPQQIYLVAT